MNPLIENVGNLNKESCIKYQSGKVNMFLSKVTLASSAQSAIELAKLSKNGVYASHQLLWRLFPNEEQRNFMYREEQGSDGRPKYFVLSNKPPEQSDTLFEINSKQFNPQLGVGTRLAFKLRVNPTICLLYTSPSPRD